MSALYPCPECHRHVRPSEPSCPFCGAAVETPPVVRPAPQLAGLGRAAIMAFGAAAAITVTSCGDDGPAPGPLYGGPPDASQADGGPPPPADGGPTPDGGGPVPLYGGAP